MRDDIAEPTVLRDGDQALDDLLDDLGAAADAANRWGVPDERPVIVETVSRYVVWVNADSDIRQMQGDYELIQRGDVPFDGGVCVSEPRGYDWNDIYDLDGDFIGPENAPAQGPVWECPERLCGAHHPPGATWERRHYPRCPHAEPKPVAGVTR